MTNSRSTSHAVSPPTDATPWPLPARADSRPISTRRSSVSPGSHLAAEPHAVDAAEQRELAGVARLEQHRDGADLGERLDHQHAGQRRPAREVPGEERLVAGEVPAAGGRLAGHDLDELVDEEERRPVREDVDRRRQASQPRALSRLAGVSFGLILGQASSILPFSSTRNAERMMPMYFLPYIDFSPHAP